MYVLEHLFYRDICLDIETYISIISKEMEQLVLESRSKNRHNIK